MNAIKAATSTRRRSLPEAELQPLHLAALPLLAFHIQQNFFHPQRSCAIPAIDRKRLSPSVASCPIPVSNTAVSLRFQYWARLLKNTSTDGR